MIANSFAAGHKGFFLLFTRVYLYEVQNATDWLLGKHHSRTSQGAFIRVHSGRSLHNVDFYNNKQLLLDYDSVKHKPVLVFERSYSYLFNFGYCNWSSCEILVRLSNRSISSSYITAYPYIYWFLWPEVYTFPYNGY